MVELGYVKGQNLAIEYIYTEGRADRYAEATQELLRRKVDILLAAGSEVALKTAMAATQSVPILLSGQ